MWELTDNLPQVATCFPGGSATKVDDSHYETAVKLRLGPLDLMFRGKLNVVERNAEAGVNLASVNYHFGSKDALLFEIFRRRTSELNRERARMLHEASDRHEGKPPVREILRAYFEPALRWSAPDSGRVIPLRRRRYSWARTCSDWSAILTDLPKQ